MTTRRGFIASLLAVTAAPRASWAAAGSPVYLAAAREPDGGYALFGLGQNGELAVRVPLPARGHAGAGHPTRAEAVVFARRPGTFALVVDCTTGRVLHRLAPPKGRQLNGHGAFAEGGALLCTSEQRSETSEGVIGLWNVEAGYIRAGEVPAHGIGPHDLRLMPDGLTLVVANGGIATDPTDRTKLNIPTMRPNFSYLALDGTLLEQIELSADLRQSSICHLALRADGLVGFAMQWEGANGAAAPLLGLHRRGEAPRLAAAPLADELAMQGYAGSIAFSGDGSEIAITSPRGGRLHRFETGETRLGEFLGSVSRSDVCGLATHLDGVLASDGFGGLVAIKQGKPAAISKKDCVWDIHIVDISRA